LLFLGIFVFFVFLYFGILIFWYFGILVIRVSMRPWQCESVIVKKWK
jgi:hypothetical protein